MSNFSYFFIWLLIIVYKAFNSKSNKELRTSEKYSNKLEIKSRKNRDEASLLFKLILKYLCTYSVVCLLNIFWKVLT